MRFQIPFEFVLPQEQNSSFIKKLGDEGNDFLVMVSTLDMEKAEAFSDYDKRQIQKLVVDHLKGYSKLNESVIGAIREFSISKAVGAISTMTEEEKASCNLLENSGQMLSDIGDLGTALRFLTEASQLKHSRLGPSVSVADTYLRMGVVEQKLGNLDKSLELNEKALEIYLNGYGPSHVSVAMTQDNIASVLRQQGKLEESLKMSELALATMIQALGPAHVSVADTKVNIGIVYCNKGDQIAAKVCYKEAYDIYLRSLGPDHPKSQNLVSFI
jgi:tetratricopeptide (TPR) repeat protein